MEENTTLTPISYDSIIEQIKKIDTTELSYKFNPDEEDLQVKVTDSKVYFWTRLFLKEEESNIEIGDDVTILYTPSGEKITTKFISYGKEGAYKDRDGIAQYDAEDDKKILCLMVDEKVINTSNEIPFIRTLFKMGRHFQYQIVKRDELQFIIDKNNIVLDYYDTSF